jgi:hypothetical protein
MSGQARKLELHICDRLSIQIHFRTAVLKPYVKTQVEDTLFQQTS